MQLLTIFARLLQVEQTVVERVRFDEKTDAVIVSVRPYDRAARRCPECSQRCPGYDRGRGRRRWRSIDFGSSRCFLEADAPRIECAEHGVRVAAVPWARPGAGHTRAFDDLVTWLVCRMSKAAVQVLLRITWRTAGEIIDRVVAEADAVAGDRLDGVRRIAVDEISYRRGQRYLTVVINYDTGRVLWIGVGRSKATLGEFFTLLGPRRCQQIALVSADGADWVFYAVAEHCPQAKICLDPFHAVAWVTKALDEIRAQVWSTARREGQKALAQGVKGARYALWKNPEDLTQRQQAKLSWIQKTNRPLFVAYLLKEQFRQIFATGGEERVELLDAWLAWASRCQLTPFVELARRIRVHFREDIVNTLIYRMSNGRMESANTKIRLLLRMAFGFKNTNALIALVKLQLGGYDIRLPGRA